MDSDWQQSLSGPSRTVLPASSVLCFLGVQGRSPLMLTPLPGVLQCSGTGPLRSASLGLESDGKLYSLISGSGGDRFNDPRNLLCDCRLSPCQDSVSPSVHR